MDQPPHIICVYVSNTCFVPYKVILDLNELGPLVEFWISGIVNQCYTVQSVLWSEMEFWVSVIVNQCYTIQSVLWSEFGFDACRTTSKPFNKFSSQMVSCAAFQATYFASIVDSATIFRFLMFKDITYAKVEMGLSKLLFQSLFIHPQTASLLYQSV